ncbi:chymotrypsin-like elastase family member 2A [Maniola jurtina]|uniref:chymotrypsin-like elastase family member 2A n=1 Tax=Maniola jurtina TaxID=191418 RepID=UPI001E686DC0|nr:chymotrypsin-like elastase family member 2A [Maniola jurtina]
MVAILILSLALFSGAASAFHLEDKQSGLTIYRYPTIVQVQFYTPGSSLDWTHNCAASILNQLYVLSAASCFSGPNYPGPEHRRIRAGVNYSSMGGGQTVYVSRAINYEDRNSTGAAVVHDISVVRLTSRLVYTDLVRQASFLRQGSVVPIGIAFHQVGWGRLCPLGAALPGGTLTWEDLGSGKTSPSESDRLSICF